MMTTFINIIAELCKGSKDAYSQLEFCFSTKTGLDKAPLSAQMITQLIDEISFLAHKSNPYAMTFLGNIYLNGWGVKPDVSKALDYARRAASLGNSGGEVLLGFMYANGAGVKKDYQRAMEWFKKGAEKNHTMAVNNIGSLYEHGLGVKKDIALAIKYYQQAASQNNSLAASNIERLTGNKFNLPA